MTDHLSTARRIFLCLTFSISIFTFQVINAQCPNPVANTSAITISNPTGGSTTTVPNSNTVTYVNGNVKFGTAIFAYTITISVGTTWVISAGSHLAVQNLNILGTLIIQDGATVSIGTLVGGGSLSVTTTGVIKMCSNSGIEVCGTTALSASPSLSYVGLSNAKAIGKFSNYPSYGGSLTMPWGSGAADSPNITIATPISAGLFNAIGLVGLAQQCTIGSNCTNLPFTVSSNCGEFFFQIYCNAGNTAPVWKE